MGRINNELIGGGTQKSANLAPPFAIWLWMTPVFHVGSKAHPDR
jgi:hypothetical protein